MAAWTNVLAAIICFADPVTRVPDTSTCEVYTTPAPAPYDKGAPLDEVSCKAAYLLDDGAFLDRVLVEYRDKHWNYIPEGYPLYPGWPVPMEVRCARWKP